jgi:hypothetical protein
MQPLLLLLRRHLLPMQRHQPLRLQLMQPRLLLQQLMQRVLLQLQPLLRHLRRTNRCHNAKRREAKASLFYS